MEVIPWPTFFGCGRFIAIGPWSSRLCSTPRPSLMPEESKHQKSVTVAFAPPLRPARKGGTFFLYGGPTLGEFRGINNRAPAPHMPSDQMKPMNAPPRTADHFGYLFRGPAALLPSGPWLECCLRELC